MIMSIIAANADQNARREPWLLTPAITEAIRTTAKSNLRTCEPGPVKAKSASPQNVANQRHTAVTKKSSVLSLNLLMCHSDLHRPRDSQLAVSHLVMIISLMLSGVKQTMQPFAVSRYFCSSLDQRLPLSMS